MKKAVVIAPYMLLALTLATESVDAAMLVASSDTPQTAPSPMGGGSSLPPGHPALGSNPGGSMMAPRELKMEHAKVVSHIDIPQFTYLEVGDKGKTRWLAATSIKVKDGDTIEFSVDSTMDNFTSAHLKRTFKSLSFVSHIKVVVAK
jgi:hypothetical protein